MFKLHDKAPKAYYLYTLLHIAIGLKQSKTEVQDLYSICNALRVSINVLYKYNKLVVVVVLP